MGKEYYLGIDVSKGYADFVLLNDQLNNVVEPWQLDDTGQGHMLLRNLIDEQCKSAEVTIYAGLESTGGYEKNWFSYLISLTNLYNLNVVKVNPSAIKGISRASLNRSVTDETSAYNIAIYLMSYKPKLQFNVVDRYEDGRSIYTFYRMLKKQNNQLSNQLEKLIYRAYPELLSFCRRGIPGWLLRMLAKYPGIQNIRKGKLITVGINQSRATMILGRLNDQNTQTSADLAFTIKETALEILHKQQKMEVIEEQLIEQYKDDKNVQLITFFKGIGISSAILLNLEIVDINRFNSVKKIAAYYGLNPEFKQSGDGKSGAHMSKKGRKAIRGALYMVAMACIRHEPEMKELYCRFRKKNNNHYFAIGVVMHKILRMVYGMLKSGKEYSIAIDRSNRERSEEKQQEVREILMKQYISNREKKRRYLIEKSELEAPISGRKAQKIKELETSLSTSGAMVQDHPQP